MKNYDDIRIPDELDHSVAKGIKEGKRILKKRKMKVIYSFASGMVAVIALITVFAVSNPTLAKSIPLIGNIFAKIEELVNVPGDYSKYAVNLSEEIIDNGVLDHELEKNNSDANSNTVDYQTNFEQYKDSLLEMYGDTDQDITIIPQEVYCDGVSIFVSLRLETNDPEGFGQEHVAEYAENNNGIGKIQIDGYFDDNPEKYHFSVYLEGTSEESTTFEGIMKVPADAVNESTTELSMHVNYLFWLDFNKWEAAKNNAEQTGSNSVMKNGDWNLTVPVQIDRTRVKVHEINDVNEQGFGIKSITITPYEMQIEPIIPEMDTGLLEQIYSEYEAQCIENLGDEKAKEFLVNAYFDSNDLNWYGNFAVFNQDGTALRLVDGVVYSTYGLENTKLYFYLMPDDITAIKCKDQSVAEKCNIYSLELSLEKKSN